MSNSNLQSLKCALNITEVLQWCLEKSQELNCIILGGGAWWVGCTTSNDGCRSSQLSRVLSVGAAGPVTNLLVLRSNITIRSRGLDDSPDPCCSITQCSAELYNFIKLQPLISLLLMFWQRTMSPISLWQLTVCQSDIGRTVWQYICLTDAVTIISLELNQQRHKTAENTIWAYNRYKQNSVKTDINIV